MRRYEKQGGKSMICSFKKLIYPQNPQTAEAGGYMIAAYDVRGNMVDAEGKRVTEAKVVGYYLPTAYGVRFDMAGRWIKNKYGMQFELENYREIIRPGRDGIVAYLSCGLIKGIGPKIAERIYDAFGDRTPEVLDNSPEDLMRIRGISESRLERIRNSYLASRGARDIVTLLAPHGVSANRAVKIFKQYGRDAIRVVRAEPYRLCEMYGISFLTADGIAKSMGLDPLSPERVAAGILHTLREAETRGHLCLENRKLVGDCVKLLDTDGLTDKTAADRAYQLLLSGDLAIYNGYAYRAETARTEQDVADRIRELLSCGAERPGIDVDAAIDNRQRKLGIKLAPEQRRAVKCCLTSHLCIISGGPGTGKTMIQHILLDIYRQSRKDAKIVCCAPTGRAARRMEQCTGYPASTIHKALGLTAGDDGGYGEPEPLDADLVLVDEVSMLDIHLARYLLNALPAGCQLALVGDADQLPSVGPGAVLSELIACGLVPVVKLDRVFRQDAGSRIAANAKRIRHDEAELDYGDDFVLLHSSGFEESADLIEKLYLDEVGRIGVDNVALLTPYRKKTETGANALNERLREKLNPPATGKPEASFGRRLFRLGDKVMQIRNKGDINNGDIGYITEIATRDGDVAVRVDFGDGRAYEYEQQELDLLEPAYACTVHKSQGSEYRSVIVNIQTRHYIMLKRPLIYTAITRAKQRVVIVGERRALHIAIHKTDAEKRGTMLAARICAAVAEPAAAANR
jgi:exodeoxyribonuclease V alpha subunit